MKLIKALLWSSLLAMVAVPALPAWAQSNTIPAQPHLLVKGEASRTVLPDRFGVRVSLETVDMKTDVARRTVQANSERAMALFTKHDAVKDSVRAENLSIEPSNTYRDDRMVFEGTKVKRELSAEFASAGALQGFLADLVASKEVQVRAIRPTFSGEPRLRAELKAEAAAQTRASAKGLAGAYGATITGLYSISDVAPNFAYGVQAGRWPESADGASSFGSGSELDRVALTGTRAPNGYSAPAPASGELLIAAPITYTENVYAIFLIKDGT